MAEQDGSVATVADETGVEETQSQTSGQGIEQPQTYTPDELREVFRDVVREENDAFWNDVRRQVTPMQQQLAELAPKIEALLPQIAEVQGDAKTTRRLVKDVLAGKTLDDSQLQAIDDAERLEDQQRTDAKHQQEKEQLQRQAEEARKGQLTPQQLAEMRHSVAWVSAQEDAVDFAHDQGYRDVKDWDDIKKITGNILRHPSNTDEFGYQDWKREVRSIILKAAAARDAEGNATVNVPSLRGAGGQSAADIVAAFGREENPIPWSPKVAAAMKELGLTI